MIREICKDEFFLSHKAEPATADDREIAQDLLDTLAAHKDGCMGMRAHFSDTNLKCIRTTYGCTQAELAKRSGVSLRSIQMYEQHNKDINKASAETVLSLAKVLGCTMEDLLEK